MGREARPGLDVGAQLVGHPALGREVVARAAVRDERGGEAAQARAARRVERGREPDVAADEHGRVGVHRLHQQAQTVGQRVRARRDPAGDARRRAQRGAHPRRVADRPARRAVGEVVLHGAAGRRIGRRAGPGGARQQHADGLRRTEVRCDGAVQRRRVERGDGRVVDRRVAALDAVGVAVAVAQTADRVARVDRLARVRGLRRGEQRRIDAPRAHPRQRRLERPPSGLGRAARRHEEHDVEDAVAQRGVGIGLIAQRQLRGDQRAVERGALAVDQVGEDLRRGGVRGQVAGDAVAQVDHRVRVVGALHDAASRHGGRRRLGRVRGRGAGGGERAEPALRRGEHRRRRDVAGHHQRRGVGPVPGVVVAAQVGRGRAHDVGPHAERRARVRRAGVERAADRLGQVRDRLRLVAVVLAQHRALLERPVRLAQQQAAHPVGFEADRELGPVRRQHRVEVGVVLGGVGVDLGAQARRDVVEPAARDGARAAEHHVLQAVREAGLARRLVERAEAVPDRGLHDRRRVVLDHDDAQAVGERALRDGIRSPTVVPDGATTPGDTAGSGDMTAGDATGGDTGGSDCAAPAAGASASRPARRARAITGWSRCGPRPARRGGTRSWPRAARRPG